MSKILELFKVFEKMIEHHEPYGQMIPCRSMHELLSEAQDEYATHNIGSIPCLKFRCNWKCRVGWKCKCGGTACRIERHSVHT